ncbi:MAG: MurR/RpiR family transcriptional regulator [Pseudomonadota bacterium]
MASFHEILDHLTRSHPTLSPQLRKAATFILENPGDVATLSMRKVAAAADVPPPTLPRLAQALGFDTYDAFRDLYRRQFQQQSHGYSEQAGRLQQRPSGNNMSGLWGAFGQASLANLEQLFAATDPAVVDKAADHILAARTVYIAGMQASFAFADYFQYVGYMARPNWVLVRNRNGVLADWVVNMDKEDTLVAIALRPCARDTIRLAEMAQNRGTKIIGITDSRASPLAARSDLVLTVPTQSPQFFESYVAAAALLEALIGFVVAKSDGDVVQAIDAVERCRHDLGEYWEEKGT